MTAQPRDPAVAAFVTAVNAGDKDAFFVTLTDDATMSDDGTDRGLAAWASPRTATWTSRTSPPTAGH